MRILDKDLEQQVRAIYRGLEHEYQYNLTYPYKLVVSPSYHWRYWRCYCGERNRSE